MNDPPPGLCWVQWVVWVDGPPLVPTEEFVLPLVAASGGRLVPEARGGASLGTSGPRWGLADMDARLHLLVGDERLEVRETWDAAAAATLAPNAAAFVESATPGTLPLAGTLVASLADLNTLRVVGVALVCGWWTTPAPLDAVLALPGLRDGAERAEIAVCHTLEGGPRAPKLVWNRWLRLRQTAPNPAGAWRETDVNTREHPLPPASLLARSGIWEDAAGFAAEGMRVWDAPADERHG